MKYSNLITIMFAVMMSMLFATACDGTIQPASDKDKTGAFPTLVCEVDCPKVVASVEATATTNTVISLSVLSKKTISYIRTFTASATAETITFDFKEGDQLVLGGPDLCGGEVKVYITLVYEDGSKSEPFLMDKCDADLNLIGVLTGGEILTDGNAITYLVPKPEPTCQELNNCTCEELKNCAGPKLPVNPGTGSLSLSSDETRINVVCTSKNTSVGITGIHYQTLTGGSSTSTFVWASPLTPAQNYGIQRMSSTKQNVQLSGALSAGNWAYVVSSGNVNGKVNTELVSCVASLPDLNVAFETVREELYVGNGISGGDGENYYDWDATSVSMYNHAGTLVEMVLRD